jgi:hypothetical protein
MVMVAVIFLHNRLWPNDFGVQGTYTIRLQLARTLALPLDHLSDSDTLITKTRRPQHHNKGLATEDELSKTSMQSKQPFVQHFQSARVYRLLKERADCVYTISSLFQDN